MGVSMKLLVLSDLHVEFAPFAPDSQAMTAADVVVLAGDIHKGAQGMAWARQTFCGQAYSRSETVIDQWWGRRSKYGMHCAHRI